MIENRPSRSGTRAARSLAARAARVFALLCCAAAAATAAPVIITENNSTRAIAVDAVTRLRDPFSITSPGFVGTDSRTRVQFFVLNLELLAGEGANALTVDAQSGSGKLYELKAEDVRPVPGFEGLQQVTVVLGADMANVGDVLLRVSLHGVASNRARVSIGQVTATPADDPGAVPMPAPATPPAATPTPTPKPYGPGTTSAADAARFLEQAAWGPTGAEVARVQQIGFKAWLDEQFALPTTAPANYTLMPTDQAQGCPASAPATCVRDNYRPYPLQTKFFQNAMYGPDQLRQRVAWAFHQTFVVSFVDINYPAWMGHYLKTIDGNAFGSYRAMLGGVTLNPSMGEYLNMRGNTRTNPNENYAREILQLFSTGVDELNLDGTPKLGGDGKRIPVYDQDDVTNFARVFTGWNLAPAKTFTNSDGVTFNVANYQDPMVVTNANNHDRCPKTLLNGFTLPGLPNCAANNTGTVDHANQELNAALDNIANHPNVGPFIGKGLIQHLVTSNPSPAYVERVARVFNNDCDALYPEGCANARGNFKAVVRAILLDPEARGDAKTDPKYGKLREPVQLINNTLRGLNATSFSGAGQSDGVIGDRSAANYPQLLDQNVYAPPTVFSYYTPLYEVPGTVLTGPVFEILSTSTALRRANTVNTFVYTGIPASGVDRPAGTALNFAALDQQASNPSQLVETLNSLLMHGTMSDAMKAQAVGAMNAIPASDAQFARKRSQAAVYLVLSSAQFQVQR